MTSESRIIAIAAPSADRGGHPRLVLGVTVILASMAIIFYHFLASQWTFAIRNPADWGHTLVIPFMAGYLAYLNRDNLRRIRFRTTWSGLCLIIVGIAWYVFCWVGPVGIRHHNLMGAGFGLTLFGVVLMFFGWSAMRFLLFPLAYLLVFGITISDRFMDIVTLRLQDFAAYGSWVGLKMVGYTVDLSGNTITIWQGAEPHPVNVAEACSGMRMLVAFMALGVFMAYTSLDRFWQRATLVLLAVPTALFVNILRVVTLGLLTLVDSNLAAGDFHSFIGLLWLVPALVIYFGIVWVLKRLVIEDGRDGAEPDARVAVDGRAPGEQTPVSAFTFDRRAMNAVIACSLTLVVCGIGFQWGVNVLNIHLMKRPVALRRPLTKIPRQLGAWKRVGEDVVLEEASEQELGTTHYLSRVYMRGNDRNAFIHLHIAYYTDQIDAVPHVPERCILAGGLASVGSPRHLPIAIDRTNWVEDPGPPNQRTGQPYHLVQAIDRWTRNAFTVRMPIPVDGDEIDLRTVVFQKTAEPDKRLIVGYFFVANGRATAHREKIRLLAFEKTDEYAYYAKVELAFRGRGEDLTDTFLELASDFLEPLLPELMRCLPDWSEVERGLYPRDESGAVSAQAPRERNRNS